ncbi:hypothetical protein Rmar_1845 [Rhodothermus marinus DSM 4252]|uniref:Uncharacterized protein n=1 Tax=Rhodothermus marinus (strain ATCC 43812 / DSM 4252 / R-10) TaxID=518766 RepID=D0MJS0_RHOM4|nr:hypothetical protein Rmar_1845 [Rhodothermus marinus DSM 4252]
MYRSYNLGQAMTLTFLMIIGLHEGRAQIIPDIPYFPNNGHISQRFTGSNHQ